MEANRHVDSRLEEEKMNVRWDAVVKINRFRTSSHVPGAAASAPEATAAGREAASSGVPVELQVWLFGMLAGSKVRNPLVLQFAGACSLCDVFNELRRRLGPEVLRTLISEGGETLNTCRVFLNGELAKDMATPIAGCGAATVEIILLREVEGG
jgi:hypothetical protein